MKKFLLVAQTGEIQQVHTGLAVPANPDGALVVEVPLDFEPEKHWYNGASFELKSESALAVDKYTIVADGIDAATVSSIPADMNVYWPDGVVTSGDPVIEFAVDQPDTYILRFSAIPYLDQEVTIEAVPAT